MGGRGGSSGLSGGGGSEWDSAHRERNNQLAEKRLEGKKGLSLAKAKMEKKDNDFFFGEGNYRYTSNKYFNFNHTPDSDNIIIATNNIKTIKGNPVLIVGNNQAVYLKDWQVRQVHNYDEGINTNLVKLNKKYFKPYTFKSDFSDYSFGKSDTFDSLQKVAKKQNKTKTKYAYGHMK